MIDDNYDVKRMITEFSDSMREFLADYELSGFDFNRFQQRFFEVNAINPMCDCNVVQKSNIALLKGLNEREPEWDFDAREYFTEAHAI